MLISISFIGLLLINGGLCGVIDAPNCNYAAVKDIGFFAIEGCYQTKVTEGNVVSYTAYKYQCRGGNSVYKLEYEGPDYCQGTPIIEQPVTSQLSGYQCDLDICPVGKVCSYEGCNACDQTCVANPDTVDTIKCYPKIVDYCVGQTDDNPSDDFQLFRKGTCDENGVMTDRFYAGIDGNTCIDVSNNPPAFEQVYDGCQFPTYWTSSCVDALDSPSCNYVAFDFTFEPINGCTKKRRYNRKRDIEYEAFNYKCNAEGSLIQYRYEGSDYCDGVAVQQYDVTNIVQRYECDGNPCNVAEICEVTGCVETDGEGNPDCSNCPNLGRLASESQRVIKTANIDCNQVILDDCHGNGVISTIGSCQDNSKDRKSDTLGISFYFDDLECAAVPVFTDVFGGDNDCKATGKRTASCDTDNFITAGGAEADNFINDNNNNNIVDNGNYLKSIENLSGLSSLEMILLLTNILTINICACICVRYVICNGNSNKYSKSKAAMFDQEEQQSLRL